MDKSASAKIVVSHLEDDYVDFTEVGDLGYVKIHESDETMGDREGASYKSL